MPCYIGDPKRDPNVENYQYPGCFKVKKLRVFLAFGIRFFLSNLWLGEGGFVVAGLVVKTPEISTKEALPMQSAVGFSVLGVFGMES